MSLVRRFLKRSPRLLILAAVALALLGVWFGVFLRFAPIHPNHTLIGGRGWFPETFSADSEYLLLAGYERGGLKAWNLSERQVHDLPDPGYYSPKTFCAIPGGSTIAVMGIDASGCIIKLLDLREGVFRRAGKLSRYPFNVDLVCSPDGRHLVCHYSTDGTAGVLVVDVATLAREWDLGGENWPAVFSPDSRFLATWSDRQGTRSVVTIWDVSSRKEHATLDLSDGWASSQTYSPDGRLLAIAGKTFDYVEAVWLWEPATGAVRGPLPSAGEPRFLDHGRTLLTRDSRLRKDTVWDVATLQRRGEFEWFDCDGVRDAQVISSGTEFAVAASHVLEPGVPNDPPGGVMCGNWPRYTGRKTEMRIGVFNGSSGRKRESIRVPDGNLIFASDSKLVAASSADGVVRVWDLAPRRPVAILLTLSALPTLLFTALLWWRFGR
jgi:WD40 repeat protein